MHISNSQINKVLAPHLHQVYSSTGMLPTGSFGKADNLTLSSSAVEMQQIKQAASALPEIRTGLVNQLRNQIEAGSYVADGSEIADKMFSSALQSIMGRC